MSDSDDNLTQHNMFENENTLLRGQGSFFNQRFNKNLASSTHTSVLHNMNSGYGLNQRSMLPINRRETSPMSLRSVPDFGHTYENSYYSRGRACESVINGRSQSPGSVGSMDSTTSAVYVAQIFKNMKFNKYDKRIIHEAYNKYFRNRERRRVGKRRKLKLFIKRNRRKSDDSGDDGSNSSMSSDDNRSVRSAIPKESILRASNRSNRAEILNFRETMKKSDMYTDCTENLRNSSLKNVFNDNYVKPTIHLTNNLSNTIRDCTSVNAMSEKDNHYKSNMGIQRDRFTKGFALPSERFNRSVMKPTINRSLLPLNSHQNPQANPRSDDSDSDNDDIFPNQTVLSLNNKVSRKRTLEKHDSTILSTEKRSKLSCPTPNQDDITFKKPQLPIRRPIKSNSNFLSGPIASKSKYPLLGFLSRSMTKGKDNILDSSKKSNETINESDPIQKWMETNQKQKDSDSDDIFTPNTVTNIHKIQKPDEKDKNDNKISPQNKGKKDRTNKKNSKKNIPDKSPQVKGVKAGPVENTTEEILISKSKQPLTGNVELINAVTNIDSQSTTKTNTERKDENISDNPLSVSEMSMKPSFIKRKLFTQKLDIADDKNASVDSLVANSPHPTTYKLREKNKVRKLATSQSCLSRDIAGGENILDLIHKIVPANQMNMTSATNQKTRNSQENDDRWDVTSVISMCNKTNESDTFTDEDIFQVNNGLKSDNKTKKTQTSKQNNEKQKMEKENVQKNNIQENNEEIDYTTSNMTTNCTSKRIVSKCVNAYWDTDFETDLEESMRLPIRSPTKNIGRLKETKASNKENIQQENLTDLNFPNLKNTKNFDCKVMLLRHQNTDCKATNLSEKKGEAFKKGLSPKKGKSVETKEDSGKKDSKEHKVTRMTGKTSESVKKKISPKQGKCLEMKKDNNAKKDNKDNKVSKMSEKKIESVKKGLSPKKGKGVETKDVNYAKKVNKENKVKKLSEKKGESVKKTASPKRDKKDNKNNVKLNISKDVQKLVTDRLTNEIIKRTSPRTPKVKSVTQIVDTKQSKNESKRQPKNCRKVLNENRITSIIKTRKQKSFLNESLNSSCERSIFTRSFTLQTKQRLL